MPKSLSLTDKAYEYIKEQIMLQVLLPGYPLNEVQISEALGMSRTPVRDAFKRLETDGLVEIIPRRGTFIKSLTPNELVMYYEVSEGLEGMLAFHIARRIKNGELDKASLDVIKKHIDDMDEYYDSDQPQQWVNSDEAFHAELYTFCENHVLVESLSRVRSHFNRVSWFITPRYVNRKLSNDEHRELYECLVAGDAEKARQVAQKQRARIREQIRSFCEI
ncbi:MAG: GntR family transcriptional regulator [Candidatus Heteroscillospira sp.]|jgi:DNA-binding GntR family transcriptional regulator